VERGGIAVTHTKIAEGSHVTVSLELVRPIIVVGVALGLIVFFASRTLRLRAQTASAHAPAPQASVTAAPANTNAPAPAPVGPKGLSEAEAALRHGRLSVWVPRTFARGLTSLPAAERYHDYSWEDLEREFKADFPNFDLRFEELDRDEFVRAMHSSPQELTFPDVAFVDNFSELGPLLRQDAVVQMWGHPRFGRAGWWVVFGQASNFAAGEAFMLWLSQPLHWTPWRASTHTIDPADVAAVQRLAQEAVQDFANRDTQSLGSIMDPEAAHFEAFGPGGTPTLLSNDPQLTFGNSRLALVLLAALGEGHETFGLRHFGVILRRTEAGWKVWLFLPDQSLPALEQLFQSFDRLGLEEEAGAQGVPKVTLLAPVDHAHLLRSPRPEIEWATVDAPLATYVVESQFSNPRREYWAPSSIKLVSPVSDEPSVRMRAPFGVGMQPHRWRVWAISKAGIVSTSEWRIIDFTN
jgi:hypothetical protein